MLNTSCFPQGGHLTGVGPMQLRRFYCYCVKEVFPPFCTAAPSRTAPMAYRLTSSTLAGSKLSALLAVRPAPSTSLQTVWSPLCGQLLDSNGFSLSDVAQIEL